MNDVAGPLVAHRKARSLQLAEDHAVRRFRAVAPRFDDQSDWHVGVVAGDNGIGDKRIGHFFHTDVQSNRLAIDVREELCAAIGAGRFAECVGLHDGRMQQNHHGED